MNTNRIFLLLVLFMQSTTQPSDFFQWDWGHFLNGLIPWMYLGGGLIALQGVEYIEREIIVTDRYLRWSKEMLINEEYWKKESDLIREKNGNLNEIIERKEKIKNSIERMEKIKEERKKKKKEEEGKKKWEQEGGGSKCDRENLLYFFFVKNLEKNLQRDPDYNRWVYKRIAENTQQRVSARYPLWQYSHSSLLFNALQTVSDGGYKKLEEIKTGCLKKLSLRTNNDFYDGFSTV